MDRGACRALILVAYLAGCLFVVSRLSAQLVLGQYEDEAPLGSWNVFGSPSAPSAGSGVIFARLADASISFSNPALLIGLPRLSACVSTSYAAATMNKFSLVNTGVVASSGNPGAGVLAFDHGAVAFRSGDWAFALGISAPESYARPAIVADSGGSSPSYELMFEQTGILRVFHSGVSRRLFRGWSVGLGINFASGSLSRMIVERTESPTRTVIITDDKRESLRGFFLNGGIVWEATKRLTGSLVFRSSHGRRGDGVSLYRYEVPEAGTDIRIDGAGAIEYLQPWVVGAGGSYRISEDWSAAAELAWFGWSAYQITYFDESSLAPRRIVRSAADERAAFGLPGPDARDGRALAGAGRRRGRMARPGERIRGRSPCRQDRAKPSLYLRPMTTNMER
jgi:hypothetical protein